MSSREEKRNLETIPVGSLGMIPLEGCTDILLHGEQKGKMSIRTASHFPATSGTAIFWVQKYQGSVPVKQRESLPNLFEVWISIF